jgi:hypothetical protein
MSGSKRGWIKMKCTCNDGIGYSCPIHGVVQKHWGVSHPTKNALKELKLEQSKNFISVGIILKWIRDAKEYSGKYSSFGDFVENGISRFK